MIQAWRRIQAWIKSFQPLRYETQDGLESLIQWPSKNIFKQYVRNHQDEA